jgi:hypothetical protein
MLELVKGLIFGIEQGAVLGQEVVVDDIAEHYVVPPGVATADLVLTYYYRPSRRSVQHFLRLSSPLPKFRSRNFGIHQVVAATPGPMAQLRAH